MLMSFCFINKSEAQQGLEVKLNASQYFDHNISCKGGNDGSIDVTCTGGVAPYTYLWNNGSTAQNRSNLIAGTYTVTISDFTHTNITKTIILTEPRAIGNVLNSPEYDGGFNISKHGYTDGSITSTIIGGTPPYRYAWNNNMMDAQL
ncbi:MAG: hypothetical protein RIQ33_2106, partial [Bacteroidota bacterium]